MLLRVFLMWKAPKAGTRLLANRGKVTVCCAARGDVGEWPRMGQTLVEDEAADRKAPVQWPSVACGAGALGASGFSATDQLRHFQLRKLYCV